MGDNKISEAAALAASLRQIADAQYTRRQRFNGRLPADVQEVLRMAADHLQGEAVPVVYGIRVKGNSAIVGVLPIPLKDFPVTNKEWDDRYEEVPLYLHPQPAELSERAVYQCPRCGTGMEVDPTAKPSAELSEVSGGSGEVGRAARYTIQTSVGPMACSVGVASEWEKSEEYIRELEAALAATGKQQVGEVQGSGNG